MKKIFNSYFWRGFLSIFNPQSICIEDFMPTDYKLPEPLSDKEALKSDWGFVKKDFANACEQLKKENPELVAKVENNKLKTKESKNEM